jgi:hypothetical protein
MFTPLPAFKKPSKIKACNHLKLLRPKIENRPFINVIFIKWIIPSEFDLRDILEFIQISDYRSSRHRFKKSNGDGMDESGFSKFLKIHQSISKLVCAYFLGKMVEKASMKGKKI